MASCHRWWWWSHRRWCRRSEPFNAPVNRDAGGGAGGDNHRGSYSRVHSTVMWRKTLWRHGDDEGWIETRCRSCLDSGVSSSQLPTTMPTVAVAEPTRHRQKKRRQQKKTKKQRNDSNEETRGKIMKK
ncbi:hypothetical protein R6Q59_000524 [Mikania micrantha]